MNPKKWILNSDGKWNLLLAKLELTFIPFNILSPLSIYTHKPNHDSDTLTRVSITKWEIVDELGSIYLISFNILLKIIRKIRHI